MTVDYHWLDGQLDGLSALMADLVRRRVAVIATLVAAPAAIAARRATSTIPVVFSVGQNPVELGLVDSLARPGGNATGTNFFNTEVSAKRLGLLHELVPNARRVAVLLNSALGSEARIVEERTLEELREAARALQLQIYVLGASTSGEIEAAVATIEHDPPDGLWVTGSGFFASHSSQIIELATRKRIPAAYSSRDIVVAGGLMSYAADVLDSIRQVAVYAGRILKGAKPADLPVVQSTKFEFVINLQTAKALGIDVPPGVFAIADEVIE